MPFSRTTYSILSLFLLCVVIHGCYCKSIRIVLRHRQQYSSEEVKDQEIIDTKGFELRKRRSVTDDRHELRQVFGDKPASKDVLDVGSRPSPAPDQQNSTQSSREKRFVFRLWRWFFPAKAPEPPTQTEVFMANYGALIVVPLMIFFTALNCYCCAQCCLYEGFLLPFKHGFRTFLHKYVAGWRKDSFDRMYYDEPTEAEGAVNAFWNRLQVLGLGAGQLPTKVADTAVGLTYAVQNLV